MILEDKWSWRRFWMLLFMAAVTVAMTACIRFFGKADEKEWLLSAISAMIFFLLIALNLEWERMEQGPFQEKAGNFVRIGITYGICCLITSAIFFVPDYARPVMLAPMMMTMVSTPFTGLLAGSFCSLLLVPFTDGSVFLLACYLLECMGGIVITRYLKRNFQPRWGCFMIVTTCFCLTVLFSRMESEAFSWKPVIYGFVSGIVTAVIAALLFRLWNGRIESSKELFYKKILSRNYELAKSMESFSPVDYAHARKVSRIAAECAKVIGRDEHLTAAAGFYYRIGRLEGEPFVENGIAVAKKHHFPPELIRILGEYNGEKYLPSTVESALVHIVDHVVTKFDLLDQTTLSSNWNQDIVVYQTLNDNSIKGLYDESGLSMNSFLRIRDYLLKEAVLYDDHHGKWKRPRV